MFCRNGGQTQGGKTTTDECAIREGLDESMLTVRKMQLTAVLRVAWPWAVMIVEGAWERAVSSQPNWRKTR
jgi:hypothetical protein